MEKHNYHRNLVKKIFEMQELEIPHQPYSHEQRKLASIEEGNLQKLRKCQKERFEGKLGKVADEPLRHEKNMSIIVLTLASRAAIRGGLSPELAFSMTDNFICTIERMNNIEQIIKVLPEYEAEFALCVNRLKHNNRQNSYVETAKDYIYKHLHNIDIHKLWEHVGINGDYLCRLFKKYEGITVKEYILMQKIDHAKDLLRYSVYRIEEIAVYLSFGSQSSFTTAFKAKTGMTPNQYRKLYYEKEEQSDGLIKL